MGIKGINIWTRSISILSLLLLFLSGLSAQDSKKDKRIFVMEIRDNIDPRMNRYVELALKQATEEQADIIIIDMDTYGGAVNDANDISIHCL